MIEKRILKVYNNGNGWKKKERPCITLQGDWFEGLGFEIGKKIIVEIKNEDNKNTITIKLLEQ